MKIYTKPCLIIENLLSRETVADGFAHDTASTFGPLGNAVTAPSPDGTGSDVNVSVTSDIASNWSEIMNGGN